MALSDEKFASTTKEIVVTRLFISMLLTAQECLSMVWGTLYLVSLPDIASKMIGKVSLGFYGKDNGEFNFKDVKFLFLLNFHLFCYFEIY